MCGIIMVTIKHHFSKQLFSEVFDLLLGILATELDLAQSNPLWWA